MEQNFSRSYSRAGLSQTKGRPDCFRCVCMNIFAINVNYNVIHVHSGFAKRKCLESGDWEDVVDVTGCANVEISNLAEQARVTISVSTVLSVPFSFDRWRCHFLLPTLLQGINCSLNCLRILQKYLHPVIHSSSFLKTSVLQTPLWKVWSQSCGKILKIELHHGCKL